MGRTGPILWHKISPRGLAGPINRTNLRGARGKKSVAPWCRARTGRRRRWNYGRRRRRRRAGGRRGCRRGGEHRRHRRRCRCDGHERRRSRLLRQRRHRRHDGARTRRRLRARRLHGRDRLAGGGLGGRHGAAMVEVERPCGGVHRGGENTCSNGGKHTDASLQIDDAMPFDR